MSSKILRRSLVLERTGLSRSTLYTMIKKGDFPAPIPLSERCVGWLESDLNAWLEKRVESQKQKSKAGA